MARETETRVIKVIAEAKGTASEIKKISDAVGSMNRSVKSTSDSLGLFRNILMGAFAGIGIRSLADMSDTMQLLGDRIKVLTGTSKGDMGKLMQDIADSANRTKTSVANLATTFSRFAISAKQMGLDTNQMIKLTETLQNSFRLTGATTEEAAGASIQLSQAFSRGALRGQELISVTSQNAYLTKLLTERYGDMGKVLAAAEKGMIKTADIMELIFKNSGKINDEAKSLTQTFGQTLIIAVNDLQLALGRLNEQFKLSEKFAKGAENLKDHLFALGAVMSALALTQIPRLVASLSSAWAILSRFVISNPIVAGLAAATVAIGLAIDKYKEYKETLNPDSVITARKRLDELNETLRDAVKYKMLYGEPLALNMDAFDSLKTKIKSLNDYINTEEKKSSAQKALDDAKEKTILDKMRKASDLALEQERMKKTYYSVNKALSEGTITVKEYYEQLLKVNKLDLDKQFKEGTIDLSKYNEELAKAKEVKLHEMFNKGALSIQDFNTQAKELKIEELNAKWQQGKYGLEEYSDQMSKIREKYATGFWEGATAGALKYASAIESIEQAGAKIVDVTFKGLEDGLVEFAEKWDQDWKKIGQSVLNEITRMTIRMYLIKPLIDGIFGGSGVAGGGGGGVPQTLSPNAAAHGATFSNSGAHFFASGGIVDTATPFSFGGSRLGVMGEAGPEAIMPLSRSSSGDLGVNVKQAPVVVNIINNAGVDVQQQETQGPNGEKVLELLIVNKVKAGIASGSFDRTFSQSFGLARKGS